MQQNALQFNQVSFHYQRTEAKESSPIIEELSFAVPQGEFVSILGPSGSGKSTLFRLITGLEQPQVGRILLDGREQAERLGKVSYMPQQDLLMPWRTILQNAMLPLELRGLEKKVAEEQVKALLSEFGLEGVEQHYPHELSGGMRQRVSFLRAILGETSLLLLDEPFSALDSLTRFAMQEWLLEKWAKWQKTILFITHDVEEALFLSDRIFVFTEKPIREIIEIEVPLPRPRQLEALAQVELIEQKQQLLAMFKGKVRL